MNREQGLGKLLDRLLLVLVVFQITFRALVSHSLNATYSPLYTGAPSTNVFAAGAGFVCMCIWLLAKVLEGRAVLRLSKVALGLFAFVVMSIVSVLVASYRLIALEHALGYASCLLMFVLVMSYFGRERLAVPWAVFMGLAVAIVAYGLMQLPLLEKARQTEEALRLAATEEGRERLGRNEVMSTFIYQNVFGAYLVLLIPILAGAFADSRKARYGVVGLAALVALVLTNSKGAWVALGIAAGVFATVVLWWKRRALGVMALVGLILMGVGAGVVLRTNPSMRVRGAYWSGAAGIIRQAPLLGVGLGNFQDHYSEHAGESFEEVKMAHNDYLQVWAETGILGVLGLLAAGYFLLRRTQPADGAEAWEPAPQPAVPVLVGMGLGFLAAATMAGTMRDLVEAPLLVPALVFVVAALYLGLGWKTEAEVLRKARLLRVGLFAGFAGVAVHMGVDFDWYEQNFVMLLLVAAAIALLVRRQYLELEVDRPLLGVGGAVVVLVTLGIVGFFLPRTLRADGLKARAAAAMREAERYELGLQKNPQDVGMAAQLMRKYKEAESALEDACRQNPLDPECFDLLAALSFRTARAMGSGETYAFYLGRAREELERAIQVRSRHEGYYLRLGQLNLELAQYYAQRQDPQGLNQAQANFYYSQAEVSFGRARELYPASPLIRYLRGKALVAQGNFREAAREWREAKRLSGAAPYRRMKLSEEQLKEIEALLKQNP